MWCVPTKYFYIDFKNYKLHAVDVVVEISFLNLARTIYPIHEDIYINEKIKQEEKAQHKDTYGDY